MQPRTAFDPRLVMCRAGAPEHASSTNVLVGLELGMHQASPEACNQLVDSLGPVGRCYLETTAGEVFRFEPYGALMRSGGSSRDWVRKPPEVRVGALAGVVPGRVRRIVMCAQPPFPLPAALLMTRGHCSDIRTRYLLERQSDRIRHHALRHPIVPLGIDRNDFQWYGEGIDVLHRPAADAPSENLGLLGEYRFAVVGARSMLDAQGATRWSVVTSADLDQLPVRLGTLRSPLVPTRHRITAIYGAFDPLRYGATSPLLTRIIGRSPIEEIVLRDLHAQRTRASIDLSRTLDRHQTQ